MDNKIEVFKNEQFGEIRTALIENEPWFVAVDVCRALEIGNSSQAISRLDADEKMITLISNEGNQRGNYQSINLEGMDRMDERNRYEEIIKENLDYNILCQDPKFDKDRFREIMDIMLDAVCSTAPTIRINGEDMPQQVVKSRFLKLNSSHIEYVLEAMNKNPSDIRNIRAYHCNAG